MKTANFPRATIQGINGQNFPFKDSKYDWLISITDFNGTDVEVEYQFERVLFLKFNDTDKVGQGEISNDQALEIATFIKEARDLKKNVWVNCHAGICRSGAITSLLIDLGWEYKDSSQSPGRIPNHLVYDKVRKHFPELKQSWDKDIILPETDIWIAAKGW
jgi:hypothetical protein